jgi:anti-anti-sigma regulatory factor
VVIDFEEVVYVDTTGAAALTGFFAYAQRYGVELSLARVHSGAHRLLQVTCVMDEIGEHRIHHTVRSRSRRGNCGCRGNGGSHG